MSKPTINGNQIIIPSEIKYLAEAVEFVEDRLRVFDTPDSIMADIAISVSELVTNAINHGNNEDNTKPVEITLALNGDTVSITITDQGTGFNPEQIADPLADENLLKDTGRGLFIVKTLMDTVNVRPRKDGTQTTITKKIK